VILSKNDGEIYKKRSFAVFCGAVHNEKLLEDVERQRHPSGTPDTIQHYSPTNNITVIINVNNAMEMSLQCVKEGHSKYAVKEVEK